ncbi:CsbD family protein [Segniliparus rotundus DSM 44985]|uniref:CsbD family protein n=1 Tax=Segniliparus rotundus (strain ATCC BAA-972 / CDC 1076 / CIP 108378 / DSM 44985 / JCM 13578) TaxID=640132 RepID=D6ZD57_SEGRD|nr:CsbD family protein [Segniliparus rotundus]ADG99244.1 CsbD family protein [Segniliparus rotundus DSM 44985]
MSFSDKAEEFGGKAKEAVGDLTDDDKLKAEGKADQASSKIKQAAEEVADKAKDAVENIKDKLSGK